MCVVFACLYLNVFTFEIDAQNSVLSKSKIVLALINMSQFHFLLALLIIGVAFVAWFILDKPQTKDNELQGMVDHIVAYIRDFFQIHSSDAQGRNVDDVNAAFTTVYETTYIELATSIVADFVKAATVDVFVIHI